MEFMGLVLYSRVSIKRPVLKSDTLQYNTLGRWVAHLIDQASDGPSIILVDRK